MSPEQVADCPASGSRAGRWLLNGRRDDYTCPPGEPRPPTRSMMMAATLGRGWNERSPGCVRTLNDGASPCADRVSEPTSRVDAGFRPGDTGPTPVAAVSDMTEAEVRPGSLRRRFLRPQTLISFAVAVAILIFVGLRLNLDPRAVWDQARRANPGLYALAFVAWYSTFFVRAVRWRLMLGRAGIDAAHGYRLPGLGGMLEILLLSWFANCVVPAKLGDAYRSYLLKQDTGAPFSTGLGTVVAERLIDLVVLFAMMTTAVIIVFSGHFPAEAQQAFVLGLILLAIAAIGLGVMWFSRHWLERLLPDRFMDQYRRLHAAIFASLRRPQLFVGMSVIIWLLEGLRFWLVAASLDATLPLATAVVIAFMGSLLTTIPVTPAGLGVVELGTGAVLTQVIGVEPTLAGSIILLDRVIGYWSLILIGLVVLFWRTRREHKAGL